MVLTEVTLAHQVTIISLNPVVIALSLFPRPTSLLSGIWYYWLVPHQHIGVYDSTLMVLLEPLASFAGVLRLLCRLTGLQPLNLKVSLSPILSQSNFSAIVSSPLWALVADDFQISPPGCLIDISTLVFQKHPTKLSRFPHKLCSCA